jgi:hypothetical protein
MTTPLHGYTRENMHIAPRELARTGMFGPVETRVYSWSLDYTSERWVKLLRTHSDHIRLPAATSARLLDAIWRAIDTHGGVYTYEIETTLYFARRKG